MERDTSGSFGDVLDNRGSADAMGQIPGSLPEGAVESVQAKGIPMRDQHGSRRSRRFGRGVEGTVVRPEEIFYPGAGQQQGGSFITQRGGSVDGGKERTGSVQTCDVSVQPGVGDAGQPAKRIDCSKRTFNPGHVRLVDIGEHMRFMAFSRSRTDVMHIVDMLEGQCSCEDCQFNKRECAHLSEGYYQLGKLFVTYIKQEMEGKR